MTQTKHGNYIQNMRKTREKNEKITEQLHRHENDTTIMGKRREKDAKIIGK